MESNDFTKLIAQRILRHKNNWKDNPNRYTGLIFDLATTMTPKEREELNMMLADFSLKFHGIRPETAESLIYQKHNNPIFRRQKVIFRIREKSQSGQFDQIRKYPFDDKKAERELRNIAFFCLITFKEMAKGKGLGFDNDQFTIPDLQSGAIAHI